MTIKNLALIAIAVALVAIAGSNIIPGSRTAGNSGYEDPIQKYQTSTSVWVGKDIATTVLGQSSGRSYIEVTNISGATSTPTSVYCAVGTEPMLYQGITITASSTRIWGRQDSVPVGALKCLSANASSTITVVSK